MWKKKAGPEHDHIDARTGIHHIHLDNPVTGGEHHLLIPLRAETCPHCSRPHPQDDLGAVDPKAVVQEALDMLTANHKAVLDYAAKHGIHVKNAKGFVR